MTTEAVPTQAHGLGSSITDGGNGRDRSQPAMALPVNVADHERIASVAVGVPMVLAGLRRGSLSGLVVAAIGGHMVYRGVTGHCRAYSLIGVNSARGKGADPTEYFERGIHVVESVTVSKPARELYDFWRKLENLPRIMSHLKGVEKIDDRRSRWVAKAPAGLTVQWEAEIINDVPGETIAWRSLYPASVDNAGSVRFAAAPGDRGTEITVTLDYIPPAGKVGWVVAKLFGTDPAAEVREDLRRFKRIMETGEIPTTEGQSHGARTLFGSLLAAD